MWRNIIPEWNFQNPSWNVRKQFPKLGNILTSTHLEPIRTTVHYNIKGYWYIIQIWILPNVLWNFFCIPITLENRIKICLSNMKYTILDMNTCQCTIELFCIPITLENRIKICLSNKKYIILICTRLIHFKAVLCLFKNRF